ncbi:MAG: ribose 5-phosphate isomerase B [Eubacteriales bacterium]
MKLAIGSDHGGHRLKGVISAWLTEQGHAVTDFGTHSLDSCDYPDYAAPVAHAVAEGTCDFGILICTTGIGISISANKVDGIRCALCHDPLSAQLTRAHNDANILAMGAGIIGDNLAIEITSNFLTSTFEGGRHKTRVDKMMSLEQ